MYLDFLNDLRTAAVAGTSKAPGKAPSPPVVPAGGGGKASVAPSVPPKKAPVAPKTPKSQTSDRHMTCLFCPSHAAISRY